MATDFLRPLIDALGKEMLSSASFRVAAISEELKILCPILTGILSLYALVEGSAKQQLKKMSAASHMLFVLHRHFKGKLFSNQLYHDLQSTFINFIFCAAKYQERLRASIWELSFKEGCKQLRCTGINLHLQSVTKCEENLESHPTWVSNTGAAMKSLIVAHRLTGTVRN